MPRIWYVEKKDGFGKWECESVEEVFNVIKENLSDKVFNDYIDSVEEDYVYIRHFDRKYKPSEVMQTLSPGYYEEMKKETILEYIEDIYNTVDQIEENEIEDIWGFEVTVEYV